MADGQNPRFSSLLTTVLGSPFLTTNDLAYPASQLNLDIDVDDHPRPSSPAPTSDFSVIDMEIEDVHTYPNSFLPRGYSSYCRSPRPNVLARSLSSGPASIGTGINTPGRGRPLYGSHNWDYPMMNASNIHPMPQSQSNSFNSLKSLIPRLWDALSSPGRSMLNLNPTPLSFESNTTQWLPQSGSHTGSSSSRGKGKGKAKAAYEYVNYSNLPPLDGEEGELIDDEACFIDVTAITGVDILALLPTELALYTLTFLCPPPLLQSTYYKPTNKPNLNFDTPHTALRAVLACCAVSRTWHRLANDNVLWRALYCARWAIDLRRAGAGESTYPIAKGNPKCPGSSLADAPLHLDWRVLYQQRIELDKRWAGTARIQPLQPVLPAENDSGNKVERQIWQPSADRGRQQIHPPPSHHARSRSLSPRRFLGNAYSVGSPSLTSNSGGWGSSLIFSSGDHPGSVSSGDSRIIYGPGFTAATGSGVYSIDTSRIAQGSNTDSYSPRVIRNPLDAMNTSTSRGKTEAWEPKVMRISGHTDSVYCLEFDSRRIITGSRDRSIKVWSVRTGRLLGTFIGAHQGSVLCLKFEKDWDRIEGDDEDVNMTTGTNGMRDESKEEEGTQLSEREEERRKEKECTRQPKGFMVSGSSDCSICVWNLEVGGVVPSVRRKRTRGRYHKELGEMSLWRNGQGLGFGDAAEFEGGYSGDNDFEENAGGTDAEREVKGEVRAILKGHIGGVLDLKTDKKWIVSCSKDTVIRVWDRRTLELHRTLRGHEGPVNAVGLQSGRVVSASGDGKMILWDIISGERLRTFEGHDRGLACIDFKDDLIMSGSNDCKIKVWSASTGECLRTLVGHEALVRALSYDPQTGRLVSASYDKTVKLWNVKTGKIVREFKGTHTSHIFDVKLNVTKIVSTSHDQKIVVLDFAAGLDSTLFV